MRMSWNIYRFKEFFKIRSKMNMCDPEEWDCQIISDMVPQPLKTVSTWRKMIPSLSGIAIAVSLPILHLGVIYTFWTPYKQEVIKEECSCSCWDTAFKGTYEEHPPGYKHLYFNLTSNTVFIWIITVLAVVICYETIKHLVKLYQQSKLRKIWLLLLLSSVYPHYYSWWSYLNAWNDDFYDQWWHQSLFSSTECVSTYIVLFLCDSDHIVKSNHLLIVFLIALLHITASSWDQFVTNVLYQQGAWHQTARDLAFMGVDLGNLVISGSYLFISKRKPQKKELAWALLTYFIFITISVILQ